jgi:diguanylate cyclase (GGDEF)-like protein
MSRSGAANKPPAPDNRLTAAEVNQLRRILSIGYAIAACTSIFAALASGPGTINVGLLVLGALEVPVVLALALIPAMPERWVKFFAFPVTMVVISVAIAVAKPLGPTPVYYLWPALTAGHYGNRRDCLVVMVMLVVGFAVGLAFSADAQIPVITYVVIVSIFVFVLGGYQRERITSILLHDELAHAAATDALTGLLNRRAFNEAFSREVERALASDLPLSVIMFDLDHFKKLNDALGHAAGDDALTAFAEIMRDKCSSLTDVLARMGGEEFAVVLFDTGADGAQRAADAIAESFAQWSRHRPTAVMTGALTTSAGIATLAPHVCTPTELLVVADRALYAAKAAGRNRVMRAGETEARLLAKVA